MKTKKYKIQFTKSGKDDMRGMKEYILCTFHYREFGQNFIKKMKKAVEKLKIFPTGYDVIDFQYRGYKIYFKPYQNYLFFFVVIVDFLFFIRVKFKQQFSADGLHKRKNN